jgi:hypothetical protein
MVLLKTNPMYKCFLSNNFSCFTLFYRSYVYSCTNMHVGNYRTQSKKLNMSILPCKMSFRNMQCYIATREVHVRAFDMHNYVLLNKIKQEKLFHAILCCSTRYTQLSHWANTLLPVYIATEQIYISLYIYFFPKKHHLEKTTGCLI